MITAMLLPIIALALISTASGATGVDQHIRILNNVPRIPLLLARQQIGHERTLQMINLGTLGQDALNMECDFSDLQEDLDGDVSINGDEELDCTLTIGDVSYAVNERCTGLAEDDTIMDCTVCLNVLEDGVTEPMEFCYEVDCNFSDFFEVINDPDSTEDDVANAYQHMEEVDCKCEFARINGEFCTACEICPFNSNEGPAASEIERQLFSRLALSCPHVDLITGACPLPNRYRGDTSPYRSSYQDDGELKGGVKLAISLLVLAIVAVGLYCCLFRKKSTKADDESNTDRSSAPSLDDVVVT